MYIGLHVKYPLFLSDINEPWIFLTTFRKILQYKISWKSVQWGPSCSMRTDGDTDMTSKQRFSQFSNVLKDYRQHVYENLIVTCSSINDLVFTKTEYLLPNPIRTDRHEENNSPFSQFWESSKNGDSSVHRKKTKFMLTLWTVIFTDTKCFYYL
jgi:hypothetical protein